MTTQQQQADDLALATTTAKPQAPPAGKPFTMGTVLRYVGIAAALVYALFPLVFIVSSAFNPSGTLSTTSLIPKGASGVNFSTLFELRPYWSWYKNSILIAGGGTLFAVFIGALAAYAFSRLRFSGRRPGLLVLLLVQMFPSLLTFVALLTIFTAVGDVIPQIGLNTAAGLLLAYLGGAMGANVWLLKGYFDTVPREIDEAATVDGASHARIFFTMHLRLIMPILVTVGILSFVGLFNEFLLASVFLKDVDSQTLAVGLWALNQADKNKYFGPFCAGALMASLPIVIAYLLAQKQLIGGMTAGSVK
jgi:arabinogalactan oligomer / maltooligosaccharide transport system permease protein